MSVTYGVRVQLHDDQGNYFASVSRADVEGVNFPRVGELFAPGALGMVLLYFLSRIGAGSLPAVKSVEHYPNLSRGGLGGGDPEVVVLIVLETSAGEAKQFLADAPDDGWRVN